MIVIGMPMVVIAITGGDYDDEDDDNEYSDDGVNMTMTTMSIARMISKRIENF